MCWNDDELVCDAVASAVVSQLKACGFDPRPAAFLCGSLRVPPCGFSLGTPATSHSPSTRTWSELRTLKLPVRVSQ